MKVYPNILMLIVFVIDTPIVVMIALLKLPLVAMTFVSSKLLFHEYNEEDEWEFTRKWGIALQFLLDGFLN